MKTVFLYLTALLILPCGLSAASAEPDTLTVRIDGIRSSEGQILIGLVTPEGEWLQSQTKPAAVEGVAFFFTALPVGEAEIMAFHDENGNYTLDRSDDGEPSEGCAAKTCLLPSEAGTEQVTLWYANEKP